MVRPNSSPEELAYKAISQYIAEPNSFQQGGTGSLYVAKHRPTGELVAIKVVSLKDHKLRLAFDNEVRILTEMRRSLFTIRMKESFEYAGRGYIVMELLSQDLYTRSESFESVEQIKDLFFQVCQGVAELHKHKVAHLDLKPENVLIDKADNVKICDFGGSFMWKRSAECYNFVGSDFYLAPEVFAHQYGYSAKQADIWSLGIMLHVLLTGAFPFEGLTKEQTMENYFASKLSFKEFDSLFPRDAECRHLLMCMLAKNPQDRPAAADLATHPWFAQTL